MDLNKRRKLNRKSNPNKYREIDKKYRLTHKIQLSESYKKWYYSHKSEIAIKNKKWRERNKETIYQDQKEYRSRSFKTMLIGKLRSSRTISKKKGRIFNIDLAYILNMLEQQNFQCKLTNIKLTHDIGLRCVSIDRIDSSIGYVKGNIQLICAGINIAKKDYSNEEMISFIKEIKES